VLKDTRPRVETLEVKTCPFCEGELRDSVIRCTRCGRSLVSEPESEPGHPTRVSASSGLGAPAVSGGSRGSKIGFPAQDPVRPASPVWADTATRTPPPPAPPRVSELRALPGDRRKSGRPDFALLLASVVAIAAAVMAWRTIGDPWVKLVITDTSDRLDPQLVGEITLKGQAALVGIIGQAVAAVIGVYGVLWFLYAFDRGSTIPWFANPSVAIVTAVIGLIGVVLSAMVWFVWQDAAVARSHAVRMSAEELRALLDLQPKPLVEIQRLSGLMRFAGAMVVGLFAACTAWWAARKRA
jgi:hypothetical protein